MAEDHQGSAAGKVALASSDYVMSSKASPKQKRDQTAATAFRHWVENGTAITVREGLCHEI